MDAWVSKHEDKIKSVIEDYANTDRQFFVDRPEGLLAFFLIDSKKYELVDGWFQNGADEKLLEDLFSAWKVTFPERPLV